MYMHDANTVKSIKTKALLSIPSKVSDFGLWGRLWS